jgi:hypothetical protein
MMSYIIIEESPNGLITHKPETAELALSLWYALDGEVQLIMNELRQEISLTELRAAAEKERL